MKRLLLILSAILVSTSGFAAQSTSGLGKSSQNLKALGSAWNSYHTIQPQLNKNDIEMGYGGQDISHSPQISATGVA